MSPVTEKINLAEKAKDYLDWLSDWYANLKPMPFEEAITDSKRTAMASADIINGFCYEGNLSSPRVAARVPPIVDLFKRAHARGVRHFILAQECHSENAEEFKAYPPHGICGTREAETVPELAALPFASEFVIARKNSLHTVTGTRFETWINDHPEVDTYIVVGDCTDLCAYDMAMDLKLRANQRDVSRRVIVPANCVQTYDLPVAAAKQIGALPHDGDFLHALFLYMMALNKIEVVKEIA